MSAHPFQPTQYLQSLSQGNSTEPSCVCSCGAQSAARALLRHNAHVDNHHFEGQQNGGLHPLATELYTKAEQHPDTARACYHLISNSFRDVLDAVSSCFLAILDELTHLLLTVDHHGPP